MRDVQAQDIRIDGTTETVVRAEAGATVAEVLQRLAPLDRTLVNVPGYDQLSIVGCTVTGSHGTGLRLPPLCETVVVVEALLLDPVHGLRSVAVVRRGVDPDTLGLSPETTVVDDPELFDAIRVGAWWLGVVTAMTYQTRRRYFLEEYRELMDWTQARAQIPALLGDADVEGLIVWINPYECRGRHDTAVATYRRHTGPARGRRAFASRHGGCLPVRTAGRWIVGNARRLRPWVLRQLLVSTRMRRPAVLPSEEALSFGSPNRIPVSACEVAIDADNTVAVADRLLERYAALRGQGTMTSSPIGLRFTSAARSTLAPQFGRASCMVEQVLVRDDRDIEPMHAAFQRWLREDEDGRPHWGQYLADDPADLVARYPRADVFLRQVAHYNPHGLWGRELHRLWSSSPEVASAA